VQDALVPQPPDRPLECLSVGAGRPLVLLHGFLLQPRIYLPFAELLADRAQVLIPSIFALPGRWTFDHAIGCLEATLDEMGVARVSLLGHSFGGGLELGLAARRPERIVECVFGDTLGVRERFGLANEALRHPFGILRMASPSAAGAFVESVATHPAQLVAAGLWGFTSHREPEIDAVVARDIPCHVLWASRDTLLDRADGREFARRLHATFTVAEAPPGYGPLDHDWMFADAPVFAAHLDRLGLYALS